VNFTFSGDNPGAPPLLSGYPVQAGEGEQVIILKPVIRIRGRAVDGETGEPIPSFRITPGKDAAWRKTSSTVSVDGLVEWETGRYEERGLRFLVEADQYKV
jgi:hypothetical protein